MSKYRKGDVVSIQGVVRYDSGDDEINIDIPGMWGSGGSYYAKIDKLTLVTPKFDVGDDVSWRIDGLYFHGRVLSVHGDHVWIDRRDGNFATVWANKLTRIDPEPAAPDPRDVEEAPPAAPETEAAE